jgi:hypothetical protein
MPVSGLRLMDIVASAKAGLRAFNTVGLELSRMQVNPDQGPAYLIRNSEMVLMDGTERRVASAAPVIRLDNCSGVTVRGARQWPGTDLLLSEKAGTKQRATLDAGTRAESDEDFWKGIASPDRPAPPKK